MFELRIAVGVEKEKTVPGRDSWNGRKSYLIYPHDFFEKGFEFLKVIEILIQFFVEYKKKKQQQIKCDEFYQKIE